MAAIGINTSKFSDQETRDWDQVQKEFKIAWPVGFDVNGGTENQIYKADDIHYSYAFIDRKMHLRKFQLTRLDDLLPIVAKLLKEPK